MNIAFVLPYWADTFGGPVTAAKNVGNVLATMGHDVSYWATATNGDREELASTAGAHLYDLDWPCAWYRSKGLTHGLTEAIPRNDVLQITGVWTYPSYAAGHIAGGGDVPYLIRPAGTLQPWALGNGYLKRLKKATYIRLIAKPLMARSACIQCASTREADQIRRLGHAGPVTVIPNGVGTVGIDAADNSQTQIYWPELKDRLVVVFMSRLSTEKGLDILIPAWAELTRRGAYKDAVLVIAGPDDRGYQKVVEGMIDAHDVRSRICMAGMVRGQRKWALLKRADVFVLPSYSENFGIVVAEAMACGTPVITTTGTPWEQLQTIDAGRWVPPTKNDITEALRDLLSMSDSQRRQMGARGAALIREHYTWDQAARKFLTVCDCILQGKPIPLHPEPKTVESVRV